LQPNNKIYVLIANNESPQSSCHTVMLAIKKNCFLEQTPMRQLFSRRSMQIYNVVKRQNYFTYTHHHIFQLLSEVILKCQLQDYKLQSIAIM